MKRIIASEDVQSHDDNKTQNRRQRRQSATQIRNFQKKVKRMNLKICDLTKKLHDFTNKKERVECCRRYCQLCKEAHTWNPLYQYLGVS